MVWPVMYAARSDASQTIASAISSGAARRLMGISAAHLSYMSFSATPAAFARDAANDASRCVAVYPGATLLKVMLSLPNSLARLFTRPTTAGRIALERIRSGIGWRTEVEVMVMNLPQWFF